MDAPPRPRLRGWLHGAMVPLAAVGLWLLWRTVAPLPALQRLPALVFGAVIVVLYATSALYHIPRGWSRRARAVLCRCDGAATLLLIVGTFVPVAYYTLEGPWQRWSMVAAAVVAVVGAGVSAAALNVPRWAAALGYVTVGWLTAIPFVHIARALPATALALLVLGGLLYMLGAVIFATRRPDPAPPWFGFHEIFHVFVVAGTTAHFVAVWRFVLSAAV